MIFTIILCHNLSKYHHTGVHTNHSIISLDCWLALILKFSTQLIQSNSVHSKIIGTDLNVLNSEQIEYLKRFKIYNEHVKIWGGDRSKVDSILYFITVVQLKLLLTLI